MIDKTRAALVVAVFVAVVTGAVYYFLGLPGDREFSNVRDLVATLKREGISCSDLSVSAPDPTPDIVDFGSCQMDGQTVNLHVYKNRQALEGHIGGNVTAREIDNPNYFTSLVAGSNWVVDTYSEATSRRIQEAIGGELH